MNLAFPRLRADRKRFAALAGMIALGISASAGADDATPREVPSFPKPYIYQDRGMGDGEPKFTFNESGMLPGWLSLAVQQRTRYETLNRSFRSGAAGSDQVVSLRTLAQATLRLHRNWNIQLEMQDSRAELADTGTPLNTSIVNAAELLEANVQWRVEGLFRDGSRSLLRGGRLTMDIGKRRLVARNRFRNTKNAFTGLDWIWQAQDGNTFRALLTLPVNRLPISQNQLLHNEAEFDEETLDRIFWGVFAATPNLPWGDHGEVYVFGLHEEDGPGSATRNRELVTPGFRLYRPKKTGHFDYEWESVLQFGTSRATLTATDTRDLDHFAHFHHIEMGYSFRAAWSPRIILAYDYASGDTDPNDGTNGRFDTLFGAAVFDFGPTSIYRAFARSNFHGPGVQFRIRPHKQVSAYIHYRAFWLASDSDVWAGNSGLRDRTGGSGSFLGQQWFLRGRWQALPNVNLESGVVYRIDGDFQESVPNAPRAGNTTYFYTSLTLSF